MKAILEYKGYLGSAEVSVEDGLIHGKLLYINDVISYAAESPKDIKTAFEAAVDDYLETCAECGDQPDTPFKGSFNVRLGSDLHRGCAMEAERAGTKLNEWVKGACEEKLKRTKNPAEKVEINVTNHHHHVHHQAGVNVQEFDESVSGPLTTFSPGRVAWTN